MSAIQTARVALFVVVLRSQKTNSLAAVCPKIASEWHKTKNGDLRPSDVTSRSAKRVWWCCLKNQEHEWNTLVHSRAASGSACPFCSRKHAAENIRMESASETRAN